MKEKTKTKQNKKKQQMRHEIKRIQSKSHQLETVSKLTKFLHHVLMKNNI